jgi:putative endonuclease
MNEDKIYQVYLLKNADGHRYVGLSENVVRRLAQHNAGESKWTAKYRPWRLAWTSEAMPLGSALKLENLLKRQKGGSGLQTLLDQHRSILDQKSGS